MAFIFNEKLLGYREKEQEKIFIFPTVRKDLLKIRGNLSMRFSCVWGLQVPVQGEF